MIRHSRLSGKSGLTGFCLSLRGIKNEYRTGFSSLKKSYPRNPTPGDQAEETLLDRPYYQIKNSIIVINMCSVTACLLKNEPTSL